MRKIIIVLLGVITPSLMWADGIHFGNIGAVKEQVHELDQKIAEQEREVNHPPNVPSNPSPSDGATNQLTNVSLSWTGGDPDAVDTVTYDVYFETNDSSPDVLVSNHQCGTTYNPGALVYDTTYYWKIIATDNHAVSTAGPVWHFSTARFGFVGKTFGGSNWDAGFSVQQTSDGGFIITGNTQSYGAGDADVWLIKTDSSGNKEWDKTFARSILAKGCSVYQTSDGGFVITGWTGSYSVEDVDVWLIKTDSSGNKQWDKTFGGSSSDYGYSVQQTSDGGFVITGWTASYGMGCYDVWLIKTNSSGYKEWDKTFGGSDVDYGYSVQQTSDGGFILTGYNSSYGAGDADVWLIKTDSSGNKQWDKTFGGSSSDTGSSVQETSDGGFIITGCTCSYGAGGPDVWLIKTNSFGNKQWDKTFGGPRFDDGCSVQQTSDGGFIITGYTNSYGTGSYNMWLIKTDLSGNKKWDKIFGGFASDYGLSVQQTSDGGYIITGYTESFGAGGRDVWLIKTDAHGNPEW